MKIELPPDYSTDKCLYRLATQIACAALVLVMFTQGEWLYWSALSIASSATALSLFIVVSDVLIFNLKKVSMKAKLVLCAVLMTACLLLAFLSDVHSGDLWYLSIAILCIPILVFDLLPRIFKINI